MKCIILLLTLVTIVVSTDYYEKELDSINIEALVRNHGQMMRYTNCFLDKRRCSGFPAIIKGYVPEILKTACVKCSPKFRYSTRRFYEELEARYPKKYEEFKRKYDPEGKGLNRLLQVLANGKPYGY